MHTHTVLGFIMGCVLLVPSMCIEFAACFVSNINYADEQITCLFVPNAQYLATLLQQSNPMSINLLFKCALLIALIILRGLMLLHKLGQLIDSCLLIISRSNAYIFISIRLFQHSHVSYKLWCKCDHVYGQCLRLMCAPLAHTHTRTHM
jgi:hypothetical protein